MQLPPGAQMPQFQGAMVHWVCNLHPDHPAAAAAATIPLGPPHAGGGHYIINAPAGAENGGGMIIVTDQSGHHQLYPAAAAGTPTTAPHPAATGIPPYTTNGVNTPPWSNQVYILFFACIWKSINYYKACRHGN